MTTTTQTSSRERVRIQPSEKRVRVFLGGEVVADSTNVEMVWEKPYYPVYYFPERDVRMEMLSQGTEVGRSPSRGDIQRLDVRSSNHTALNAAYTHPSSPVEALRGLIAFEWGAMDGWFEEDEEVFVHARNPYTRVDVLASSRQIRVVVDGVEVANSSNARLLFETGLPVRYYLPKPDVRMDLLTPTSTRTECPYKGSAEYWSVRASETEFEDVVWGYRSPVREAAQIAGLVCFYNEKVDIYVDDVLQTRPKTVFS